MFKEPKCCFCKNYMANKEGIMPICKGYPKGIPLKIFRESVVCIELETEKCFNNEECQSL